jgi:hypothetical protein
MRVSVVLVTRNKSITVKTLHSLLKLNICCIQSNNQLDISFVNDDPFDISKNISKSLKNFDRIFFVDYSAYVDDETIKKVFSKFPNGYSGFVAPAVKEGIDWDMFKSKVSSGSDEPIEQMGLNFDTEVDRKIDDEFWNVKSTSPRVWVIDTKSTIKAIRTKKGEGLTFPVNRDDIFSKIKICAFVKARVIFTYTHECLSNILESAGVKASR